MDLITLMPWEWGSGRRHLNKRKQAKEEAAHSSHYGRELLWDYSVLDIASLGDGRLSRHNPNPNPNPDPNPGPKLTLPLTLLLRLVIEE